MIYQLFFLINAEFTIIEMNLKNLLISLMIYFLLLSFIFSLFYNLNFLKMFFSKLNYKSLIFMLLFLMMGLGIFCYFFFDASLIKLLTSFNMESLMTHCSTSNSINYPESSDSEIIEMEEESFQTVGPDLEGTSIVSNVVTGQFIGFFMAAFFFFGLKYYGVL